MMILSLLYCSTLSVLCTYVSGEERMRILLKHPDSGRHYVANYDETSTPMVSGQEAKRRCLQSVGLTEYRLIHRSYEFLDDRMKMSDSLVNEIITGDVNRFYENIGRSIRDDTEYASQIIALEDRDDLFARMSLLNVNAIICATRANKQEQKAAWLIANNKPTDEEDTPIYILEGNKYVSYPFFVALLEYVAVIVQDESFNDFRQMEMEFVESQKRSVEGTPKKDICEVKGIERFSLCSTMHWGWFGVALQFNNNAFINQILQSDQEGCINNPIIEFTKIDPVVFGSVDYNAVELVECSVNNETKFYVTADQKVHGGAYIMVKNNDRYNVGFRMHKISALKRVFKV